MSNTQENTYTPGPYFVLGRNVMADNGKMVVCTPNGDTVEEVYANARLFAASLVMLEAFKEIVEITRLSPIPTNRLVNKIAMNMIAKATNTK